MEKHQTLGDVSSEFFARMDMAVNQPRDKEGKFASTGSAGGAAAPSSPSANPTEISLKGMRMRMVQPSPGDSEKQYAQNVPLLVADPLFQRVSAATSKVGVDLLPVAAPANNTGIAIDAIREGRFLANFSLSGHVRQRGYNLSKEEESLVRRIKFSLMGDPF